jgi:hypothetical protein
MKYSHNILPIPIPDELLFIILFNYLTDLVVSAVKFTDPLFILLLKLIFSGDRNLLGFSNSYLNNGLVIFSY